MSLRKKLKIDCNTDDNDECDLNAESEYFTKENNQNENKNIDKPISTENISKQFLDIELDLVEKLNTLRFPKFVSCVYSPLEYAFLTHSKFVNQYCANTKKLLFLGLNPGPWGMSQTGIPFGEVNVVRDWLKIEGEVQKPKKELPARPITGLACPRSEVSGKRFWGLFQTICGEPENFFKVAYAHNYCPISLMRDTGSNITPADLKNKESTKLLKYCDDNLIKVINLLQVETIVAVGRFVEKRIKNIIFRENNITNVRVVCLLHPSPIVPKNENWQEKATKQLEEFDLLKYFNKE